MQDSLIFEKVYHEACYSEFRHKGGNYTPAFSMKLLPTNAAFM